MQRFTAIAMVFSALIVAVALIYHGRQLASMDKRLEKFSTELPLIIEQAGKGAGQQAVHGIIEEAFQKPFSKVASKFTHATSNVQKNADSNLDVTRLIPDGGIPLIRFDIPSPVVNIEILTNIKDLPSLQWGARTNSTQAIATEADKK